MGEIDLNTFDKPKVKPQPKFDEGLPWADPKKYSYKEIQKIEICQRCGKQLSPKGNRWINADRRTCETCWRSNA